MSELENHDIWGFKFFSVREWKGKEKKVSDGRSGIYYSIEEVWVSPRWIENLGFYVHEFTEATIIQIFDRLGLDYNAKVHYKKWGFKSTYIVHFISPLGTNNGCNLEPATHKNTARWHPK